MHSLIHCKSINFTQQLSNNLIIVMLRTYAVELGRRFFPRCSQVLDKIMDTDDLSQLAYLRNDSPDERETKKQRYTEIQELLNEAFSEDKEEFHRSNNLSSNLSSSASSTSPGVKPNGSPLVNR